MTQSELADATGSGGVKQQTIQQLEAGIIKTTRKLNLLAKALGVSFEWLATGEGSMRGEDQAEALTMSQALELMKSDYEGADPLLRNAVDALYSTYKKSHTEGKRIASAVLALTDTADD